MPTCAPSGEHPLFALHCVSHGYSTPAGQIGVLDRLDLTLAYGQSCALLGASGSGKSTLLNLLGLLETPLSGRLIMAGRDVTQASADQRAGWRNRQIGFVFQSFHLLPRLSVLDNVALPLLYRGIPRHQAQAMAWPLLQQVGLESRARHRPAELSGGQRQRVAIARALVGEPQVILADEPTGNLDQASADGVVDLLLRLNAQRGVSLIMVTHDPRLAARLQRQLRLEHGRLCE
ncbi:ABC transporter ATP-binding protein [Pseudomonas sp. nanlin1]|uniref:ABC transporter ATP-binding protein n=1 Tax=Pseudomonas sp. nanlin1 TaxID=3040605 RepID=UPI00388DAEE6